jgi:NADPH:quinone reductase-like Zn-dependent oxidoreductase
VLIKVRAASVNPLDWKLMRGVSAIVRTVVKPKTTIPGRDVAGEVEAVGKNVTRFKPGDAVFGTTVGTFAEYVCASESSLAIKPESVTFEQAASIPVAGYTALQGLRDKGKIRAGSRVLINGAAGGVGTFALQIAKSFGADVTGVCSARNVEMVRSNGADHVIDYTREDFTQGANRYDVLLDCMGNHSLSEYRRVLNPKGRCAVVGGKEFGTMLSMAAKGIVLSRIVSQKFMFFIARSSAEDLATLANLVVSGKVTPVIDRRYPFSNVPDAMRYMEEGHARGKVVIVLE